jgi:predicted permease
MTSVLPLTGDSDVSFIIEGRPAPASQSETPVTWYRLVSAGYLDVMGMTLRQGRPFEAREAAPSVIVNETLVRTFFRNENPLGRRLRFSAAADAPWFTIVGVVADAKIRGAREATRVETFIPYWQLTEPGMYVVLKGANVTSLAPALRQAVASLDPNIPVAGMTTLSEMVGDSIDQPRFLATLAVAFAVLALTLAAVGIYGVMAYAVSQRTTEIGVRMALGATSREVFRLVIGDALRMTAVGVALGLAGSILVAQGLATLLFGVAPYDARTFAVTAGVLMAVAALASFLPARRATRVDPMVALRGD